MTRKLYFVITIVIVICAGLHGQTFNGSLSKKSPVVSAIKHKFNPPTPWREAHSSGPTHRTCHSDFIDSINRVKYNLPTIEQFEKSFHRSIDELIRTKGTESFEAVIPVIVHVVHNGEAVGIGSNIAATQVYSQLDVLNEDFNKMSGTPGYNDHALGANIEITFEPALRDELGNTLDEPGIHRIHGGRAAWNPTTDGGAIEGILKPLTIWEPKSYCNIWTINVGSSDILGYAQFPNLSGLEGLEANEGLAKTDGVVIRYDAFGRSGDLISSFDGGRTATHEIGHWLGLRHIWGDGDCSVDDYCEDTPVAGNPNYYCEVVNSCFEDEGFDMIENYMDYTPDACMNIFTNGQKVRMRTVLDVCPRRKELIESDVHLILERPIALFQTSKTQACTNESIELTGSTINQPSSWLWNFYDEGGSLIGSFGEKDLIVSFPAEGIYSVEHTASNSSGSDTTFEQNLLTIVSENELQVPYFESFENVETIFENWVVLNPDGDRQWSIISGYSSDSGTVSLVFDNYSDYDGDPSGKVDGLISPRIDLSSLENPYLNFDVAYAKYGGDYSDTLVIWASTDCFDSFFPIWIKGGTDLATSSSTQEIYYPESGDWIQERISLESLSGFSSVHLLFANWSGWGNYLYIDNIAVYNATTQAGSISEFYSVKDTVTVGSEVSFTDFSENFPNSWNWEFFGGDPSASDLQNPYITYNNTGTFSVKLTTSNANGGNSITKENYITVINPPEIALSTDQAGNEVCKGDSITVYAEGADYYEWYDDRGYYMGFSYESLVLYPQLTSTYHVIGKDWFGGETLDSITIHHFDYPEIDLGNDTLITTIDTLQLNPGAGYSKYVWFNGRLDQTYPVYGHEYPPGVYEFSVEVYNGLNCAVYDTIVVTIEKSATGMEDFRTSHIRIYPNPANDVINVNTANSQEIDWIIINDLAGKTLKSIKIDQFEDASADVSDLTEGIYIIKITGDNLDVYKPLIIQR